MSSTVSHWNGDAPALAAGKSSSSSATISTIQITATRPYKSLPASHTNHCHALPYKALPGSSSPYKSLLHQPAPTQSTAS